MSIKLDTCLSVNVRNFGAKSGDENCTDSFQKAIDYCRDNGGGQVVVPDGVFTISGIQLYSKISLLLKAGAIIRGSRNPHDYIAYDEKYRSIIYVIDANDVEIVGELGSFIDGRDCYDPEGEGGYKGPNTISVYNSSFVFLSGYSAIDSGNSFHYFNSSRNIVCRSIKMYGGHHSFEMWSNDAIIIDKCSMLNSDSCILGFDDISITIKHSSFSSPCSALNIAGNDIQVEACNIDTPSRYGNRNELTDEQKQKSFPTDYLCSHDDTTFYSHFSDGSIIPRKPCGNILFKKCTVAVPYILNLSFGNGPNCKKYSLENVEFDDCVFDCLQGPIVLKGDRYNPVTLILNNILVKTSHDFGDKPFIEAAHFSVIEMNEVSMLNIESPWILLKTKGHIAINSCTDIKVVLEEEIDELYG